MQYYDHSGIVLDFSKTRWFEANLTSVLGTVVNYAIENDKGFEIKYINKSIRNVFEKNGFLNHYNLGMYPDTYNSTIEYKVFNVTDTDSFGEYISSEVVPKIRITIDNPIKKTFISSLNELFVNVDLHAKSKEVFTCGQYYHTKKKVAFTITDLGNTVPYNIKKIEKHKNLNDSELISWATGYGNTTRTNGNGGLGLYMIDKFLEENQGIFQIMSGMGYWEKKNGNINKIPLDYHFPGTIVNIITELKSTSFSWNEEILF